jgi:hypothetical protein
VRIVHVLSVAFKNLIEVSSNRSKLPVCIVMVHLRSKTRPMCGVVILTSIMNIIKIHSITRVCKIQNKSSTIDEKLCNIVFAYMNVCNIVLCATKMVQTYAP